MAKYQLPPLLIDHLDSIPHKDTILERQWITTNDLIYIHQKYLSHSIPLSSLVDSLTFYKPPAKPSSYTPQFKKQLQLLQAKQDEREYQSMINRDKLEIDQGEYISPSQMAKEVKSQITTIFNILVSTLSVAYAIWYWSNSSGYFSLATRVLMTLFFAILTLVAEVVVFNSFIRKMDDAKTRERKKKEIKMVVDTIVLSNE